MRGEGGGAGEGRRHKPQRRAGSTKHPDLGAARGDQGSNQPASSTTARACATSVVDNAAISSVSLVPPSTSVFSSARSHSLLPFASDPTPILKHLATRDKRFSVAIHRCYALRRRPLRFHDASLAPRPRSFPSDCCSESTFHLLVLLPQDSARRLHTTFSLQPKWLPTTTTTRPTPMLPAPPAHTTTSTTTD